MRVRLVINIHQRLELFVSVRPVSIASSYSKKNRHGNQLLHERACVDLKGFRLAFDTAGYMSKEYVKLASLV